MTRVRIFSGAGAALALAALAWCLSDAQGDVDGVVAAVLSRPAGLALFGLAMVAAGVVFRTAMATPSPVSTKAAPRRASEFRRGFGRDHKPQTRERDVIVALRRAAALRAREAAVPAASGTSLSPEAEARLRTLLHDRAAQMRSRDAAIAKHQSRRRRFFGHGLTGYKRPRS